MEMGHDQTTTIPASHQAPARHFKARPTAKALGPRNGRAQTCAIEAGTHQPLNDAV